MSGTMRVNTTYSHRSNRTPALPVSDSVTHIFHVHQKPGRGLNCYGVSAWLRHLAFGHTSVVIAKCSVLSAKRRFSCSGKLNEELHYGGLRLVWISYLWLDLNAGELALRRSKFGHFVQSATSH